MNTKSAWKQMKKKQKLYKYVWANKINNLDLENPDNLLLKNQLETFNF